MAKKAMILHRLTVILRNTVSSLLLISVLSNPAFAQDLPPTAKDIQKLRYLAGLEEALPKMFEQTPPFGFNILDILDQQAKVFKELQKADRYRSGLAHPLLQFTIQPGEPLTLDADAVKKWKESLSSKLKTFKSGVSVQKEIHSRLAKLTTELGPGASQGLRTGLINSLSREERVEFFKMDSKTLIEKLRKSLPEDLSAAGFRGESYGLGSSSIAKEKALHLLVEKMNIEAEISRLHQLSLVLSTWGKDYPGSVAEAQKFVEKFSNEKILTLSNKKELESAMAVSVDAPGKQVWFGDLERSIKDLVKTESKPSLINKSIRLTELPPTIGLFRGYLGGDCSTKFSCAYVWGPDERTFMVAAEDGSRKGYVSGTIVKVNGKSSFYIHTINGPKISTSETRAIFEGLDQVAEQIGVSKVALATKSLHSTVNYSEIKQGFLDHTNQQPDVKLKYQDTYARAKIDLLMDGSYDRVGANQVGAVFVRDVNYRPVQIRIESNTLKFNPAPVSKERALRMAIDFTRVGENDVAKRIAVAVGKSSEVFEKFMLQMDNPKKVSTAKYTSEMVDKFKAWGIDLDSNQLVKKPMWFSSGLIQASDALDSQHRVQTLNLVFDQFAATKISLDVLDFVENNPQVIKSDARFLPLIRKMTFDGNYQVSQLVRKTGFTDEYISLLKEWTKEVTDTSQLLKVIPLMTGLDDGKGFEFLIHYIDHEDKKIREAAQDILAWSDREKLQKYMDRLYPYLNHANPKISEEIAIQLLSSGRVNADLKMHEKWFEILRGSNEVARSSVLNYAEYIDLDKNPKALKILEEFRDSPSSSLRQMVAKKLRLMPQIQENSKLFFSFEKLLLDPDTEVAKLAANAFPAKELTDFIEKKTDLKPYVNLVSKVNEIQPIHPSSYRLIAAALDDPSTRNQAFKTLSEMPNLPKEIEARARTFLTAKSDTLDGALRGLSQSFRANDEKKIIGFLLTPQHNIDRITRNWLQYTHYEFKTKAALDQIVHFAYSSPKKAKAFSASALIYLMKKAPTDEMRLKAFKAAMKSGTGESVVILRISAIESWLSDEFLFENGKPFVIRSLETDRNHHLGSLFKTKKLWQDPELAEALRKATILSNDPMNNFFSLIQGEAPANQESVSRLIRELYDLIPNQQRWSYLSSLATNVAKFSPDANRKVRRLALDLLFETDQARIRSALVQMLKSTPLTDPKDLPFLLKAFHKPKHWVLLNELFEIYPLTPELAVEVLHSVPLEVQKTKSFWQLMKKVTDPKDARFQLALAEAVSTSKPRTQLRKEGLSFFSQYPSEDPEVKKLIESAPRGSSNKPPADCGQAFRMLLRAIEKR